MLGVAVNVTGLPSHILAPVEVIFTDAIADVTTVMVIALDVAGEPVTQAAFDVITTVTLFPFVKAEEVYVAAFVPTFVPFTFH